MMKALRILVTTVTLSAVCALTSLADLAPVPPAPLPAEDTVSPVVLAFCAAALTMAVAFMVRKIVRKNRR